MATGNTYTGSLADSLPTMIASARNIREYEGVMPQVCDKVTLAEGTGLTWNEVYFSQLEAQTVSETATLDNPQQISDTLFSITPTVIGIETILTDRVKMRIAKTAFARLGKLAQEAIQRKKDEDGLTVLDSATTSLCGAGSTLTTGHISAAVARILGNATEPGKQPIRAVLHGYQIKDIIDEITAGVGTYAIDKDGVTAKAFTDYYIGKIFGAEIYEDGNIAIDSSDDAKGGVFCKEAIVLVQGKAPWVETERRQVGGGADAIFLYDEYGYGERGGGVWLYEIYSDATAPTS
jgi:hypothetical protein